MKNESFTTDVSVHKEELINFCNLSTSGSRRYRKPKKNFNTTIAAIQKQFATAYSEMGSTNELPDPQTYTLQYLQGERKKVAPPTTFVDILAMR